MRKAAILLSFLIFIFFITALDAHAESIKKFHESGVLNDVIVNQEIIEENDKYTLIKIIEIDGIKATNNILIENDIIHGEIYVDKDLYKLEGKLNQQEKKFNGIVNNDESLQFEAFMSDSLENGRYVLYVVMDDLKAGNKTFIFNGQKPKVAISTIKESKLDDELASEYQALSSSYYQLRNQVNTTYLSTAVYGPVEVRSKGGSANYSVRSTTNTSKVTQDLRNQGWSVWGTKVSNWTVTYKAAESTVFNVVSPTNTSETYFNSPLYLPYIGYTTIPVKLSSIGISGAGSRSLKYKFDWSNYGTAFPGDNSGLSNKPTNTGLGAIAEWKVALSSSASVYNTITTNLTYISHAYSTSVPKTYLTKNVTVNVSTLLRVVN